MDQPPANPDSSPSAESSPFASQEPIFRPRKKGFTVLSWLIILALVALVVARPFLETGANQAVQADRLQLILFEMQARYLVGAANVVSAERGKIYAQAAPLDGGSNEQRLRFAVLAGELAGPKEALNKLADLMPKLKSADERRSGSLLDELYHDYLAGDQAGSSLNKQDKEHLQEDLGWFGELALNPPRENRLGAAVAPAAGAAPAIVLDKPAGALAERQRVLAPALATFLILLGLTIALCVLGLAGLVGLVIFVVFYVQGRLNGGLKVGTLHAGVYAETFALYFLTFFGLSLALHWLPMDLPTLARAAFATLASLIVLIWPVIRGIPWLQVREEIGWTLGRQPALEPALGPACYVMALPIVAIGVAFTLLLMFLRNELDAFGLGFLAQHEPVHPIVEFIVNGTAMDRILVFLDACILAPIVEETMFRGVLYRHLRDLTARWRAFWSVVFSGTIAAFIFAVIHPQGLVAVPVLMSLAYGFTIAREWRGTLIPGMVGHALNNTAVLVLVIVVMGR